MFYALMGNNGRGTFFQLKMNGNLIRGHCFSLQILLLQGAIGLAYTMAWLLHHPFHELIEKKNCSCFIDVKKYLNFSLINNCYYSLIFKCLKYCSKYLQRLGTYSKFQPSRDKSLLRVIISTQFDSFMIK